MTPGSAERNRSDRPSVKRAIAWRAIARGSRLGERHGRDPLPKSLSATAAGLGERSPQAVAANPASGESAGESRRTNSTEGSAMAAIEIQGLSKRFGDITAVDDLSFSTREGAVTGFLGPNGAGKTTTPRLLLGPVRPTQGTAPGDGRPHPQTPQPTRPARARPP